MESFHDDRSRTHHHRLPVTPVFDGAKFDSGQKGFTPPSSVSPCSINEVKMMKMKLSFLLPAMLVLTTLQATAGDITRTISFRATAFP